MTEIFDSDCVPQTVHDGRQFMKYIDPKLGVPLPERDYGGNCLLYDPGNTTDPFHNIWVRLRFLWLRRITFDTEKKYTDAALIPCNIFLDAFFCQP